jgi:hypothetical protein
MSDFDNDPRDLAMIAADDELLDLLGSGGTPGDDDEVGAMLAAWRADLATDLPTVRRAAPVVAPPPARRRSLSRNTRFLLSAAAAVIALAGVATVMAGDARPGSPLWPITRLLYTDRANSAVAEQEAQRAIDEARQAINDARYADAEKLLEQATARTGEVRDPTVVQRLQEEIAALQGLLPGVLPGSSPVAGGTDQGSGGGGGGGGSGGGGGGTAPPTTPGGLLPTNVVPTGILPTGIVPTGILPTTILPPVLPGLP